MTSNRPFVDRLAALRTAIENATPGPWAYSEDDLTIWCATDGEGCGGAIFEIADPYPRSVNHPTESAELTVLLRNNAATLIEIAEAAWALRQSEGLNVLARAGRVTQYDHQIRSVLDDALDRLEVPGA